MARLDVDTLRRRATTPLQRAWHKDAGRLLHELARADARTEHDVFLSHNHLDKTAVLGLKTLLEDAGYSVYVDSEADPQVDPSTVTAATVGLVRRRLAGCRSLLYATSENAEASKWMAWELGLGDGLGKPVASVPITGAAGALTSREFLLAYAQAEEGDQTTVLWIKRTDGGYVQFDRWLNSHRLQHLGHQLR